MKERLRSEVSEKSQFYVSKHRYLELKHFCLQYRTFLMARNALYMRLPSNYISDGTQKRFEKNDPVGKIVETIERYDRRMGKVDKTLELCDPVIAKYLKKGVTEGLSYEAMNAFEKIPCGKGYYYKEYRKFFYILSKIRDLNEKEVEEWVSGRSY